MVASHLLVLDISKKRYDEDYGLKKNKENAKKNIKKGMVGKLNYLRDLDLQRDKGVLPFAYFWVLLFVFANVLVFHLVSDYSSGVVGILLFVWYVYAIFVIFSLSRMKKYVWYRIYYIVFMFSFVFFMFHTMEYEPLWLFDWKVNPIIVLLMGASIYYVIKKIWGR